MCAWDAHVVVVAAARAGVHLADAKADRAWHCEVKWTGRDSRNRTCAKKCAQPQPVQPGRCSAALTGRDRGFVCGCEVCRTHVHHMVEHISRVVPTQATERGVAIVGSTALALLIWSIAIAKFQVKIFRVRFSDKSQLDSEFGCSKKGVRKRGCVHVSGDWQCYGAHSSNMHDLRDSQGMALWSWLASQLADRSCRTERV